MSINNLLGSTNDPIGSYYFFGREKLYEGLTFEFNADVDSYQGLYIENKTENFLIKDYIKDPVQLLSQMVTLVKSQTSQSNNLVSLYSSLTQPNDQMVKDFVRNGFTRPVLYVGPQSDLVELKITSNDHVIFEANDTKLYHYAQELVSPHFDYLKLKSNDLIEVIKNKKIQITIRVIQIDEFAAGEHLNNPKVFIEKSVKHYLAHLHLLLKKGGNDRIISERFKMFGITVSPNLDQDIDNYIQQSYFQFDDCLKMILLMKKINSSEENDIILESINNQSRNINDYLSKWQKYYTETKVLGPVVEDKNAFR